MRYLTADHIFNGKFFLPQKSVLIVSENGSIHDIVPFDVITNSAVQKLEGIITPGFVNVHGHIELSHLKNNVAPKRGIVDFAKNIIQKRNSIAPPEKIVEAMQRADEEMAKNGIVLAGDICNTEISFPIKAAGKITYHSFIELIGLNPKYADNIFEEGKKLCGIADSFSISNSLAAHAPYSVSTLLMEKIIEFNNVSNKPFSIHNQESEEENKFLQGKKCDFNDLYDFLKIDISWFSPNSGSSFKHCLPLLTNTSCILVHNTFMYDEDASKIPAKAFICFCPNANLYIENALPPFKKISESTNAICFGTDSLASNTELNIINEANLFLKQTHNIEQCLQGLCYNGARALKMENKFGLIEKGRKPGLNLIQINHNQIQFIKKLC